MAKRVRAEDDSDVHNIQLAFERLLQEETKEDTAHTARLRAEVNRLRAEVEDLQTETVRLKNQTSSSRHNQFAQVVHLFELLR